jgi:molybdenum cofactor biosynthesis enzyme MoaA
MAAECSTPRARPGVAVLAVVPPLPARARRAGHADVHLATNGVLLDAERVDRLIDLGVTSVMVSLDGASAATNDRVRLGGRFEQVVANVRAARARRAARGADLRIGLSTVVGRGNRQELAALARLCASLGIDWLELEETYSCTPFARLDALPLDDAGVRAGRAEAAATLAAAGVVLVDHLAPPAGCVSA